MWDGRRRRRSDHRGATDSKQISDTGEIEQMVDAIIAANPAK